MVGSIVELKRFVHAIRDAGYKSLSTALAELIDNSLEAGANDVRIQIEEKGSEVGRDVVVSVRDNGCGMTSEILRLALQFGGTTRFNSRSSAGRFGMGLPNSSLSQCRRVEVFTWISPKRVIWSHLDVDEVSSGSMEEIPKPTRGKRENCGGERISSEHGTLVVWKKCDRLAKRRIRPLLSKLHTDLGQMFRYQIWRGRRILINDILLEPVDPLMMKDGKNLVGAVLYGPPLRYPVEQAGEGSRRETSEVRVQFVVLPVSEWHGLSNEDKRKWRIANKAGISVLRSGREIDYGWFFMGKKRRENYDDWWRCEVNFEPAMDELFGVTHTKQGIRPKEELNIILRPEMEKIAHKLNSKVRSEFARARSANLSSTILKRVEERDHYLEPPRLLVREQSANGGLDVTEKKPIGRLRLKGIKYRILKQSLNDLSFFVPSFSDGELRVIINEEHPFFEGLYSELKGLQANRLATFKEALDLLILAFSRAEVSLAGKQKRRWLEELRESWSNNLAVFLS